jgi:hypothetical protein
MEQDIRLNAQLKSLGKKLFQFRDLIAKLDIPESLPPPPHDRVFWDAFVSKCTSAVTVLKQVHASLTPDMYHLSVYPGDKIWRNPSAVPDLLSIPELPGRTHTSPVAHSQEQVAAWNAALEKANLSLDELTENMNQQPNNSSPKKSASSKPVHDVSNTALISSLLTTKSTDRILASSSRS